MLSEALIYHHAKINDGFSKAEDALDINMKVKLSLSKDYAGAIDIKTTITFVADRVKDESHEIVDEDQMDLFKENKNGGS